MAHWGPSEDDKIKSHNDLMNWMKGCKKFSEAELKKIEFMVRQIEHANYNLGHEWGELESDPEGI